jgi:phosphoribosyl-dephospho-CoA transferase
MDAIVPVNSTVVASSRPAWRPKSCDRQRAVIEALRRHDLLLVETDAWPRALERTAGIPARPDLRGWASRGWPVMVRRYQPGEAADLIPVAIALPREAGKKPGVTLQLRAAEVRERLKPVALADCVDVAPPAWRESLQCVLDLGSRLRVLPSVFGSLLWQRMTGLTYLHEGSDLDLLWQVTRAGQARSLACSIEQCVAGGTLRIDGEFVLPDGAGVHWREWLDGGDEVIVKTLHGAHSRARSQLFPAEAATLPC